MILGYRSPVQARQRPFLSGRSESVPPARGKSLDLICDFVPLLVWPLLPVCSPLRAVSQVLVAISQVYRAFHNLSQVIY